MRYPYPNYRDSSVEWLGQVPEHWKECQLRNLLSEPLEYGASEAARIDDPGFPRYVRITDIDEMGFLKPETFRSLPTEIAAPFLLREGDLLLAGSGSVGKAFLYRDEYGPCAYASYLIRARFDKQLACAPFMKYFTASKVYWQWIEATAIQATIQNVSAGRYAAMKLAVPPLEEQRAISAYLDQETGKVDVLVEKKRLLLERLAEYRTALITRAVTRGLPPQAARAAGLDPSPFLKPSGVDWLGDIPEHWEVKRLAHSVRRSDVRIEPEEAQGVPFVGLEHVSSWTGHLLPLDDGWASESLSNSFRDGDVLFAKLRPYLAKAFLADFDGLCSTEFLVLEAVDHLPEYLLYLLLTDGFVSIVDSSTYGAKMPRASWDFVCGVHVPVPPVGEQRAITAFLDKRTERIDRLCSRVEEAIERLHEYRTALVTAAVTGKIDVREEVKAEARGISR
ncbi:restriction endonuclease subunit S [Candidatus Poriferisocius sp.]|uniref:restriction endonuclease subunit S n=1 Tax=Candidatus Poriferisocius sp. TaxID=3101276 RepID=UPI003B0200F4